MKKMALSVLLVLLTSLSVSANTEKEILFREIPWESDMNTVKTSIGTLRWGDWKGESVNTYPIAQIVKGESAYNRFAYTDINVHSIAHDPGINVAGYEVDEIGLYFAYVPDADGKIDTESPQTSFYAADYHLVFSDLDNACKDLTEKLTSLYGEPDNQESDENWTKTKTELTYWNGTNGTSVILKKEDNTENTFDLDSAITLIYTYEKGDELLQNASDAIAKEKGDLESNIYGNGNTDGL